VAVAVLLALGLWFIGQGRARQSRDAVVWID